MRGWDRYVSTSVGEAVVDVLRLFRNLKIFVFFLGGDDVSGWMEEVDGESWLTFAVRSSFMGWTSSSVHQAVLNRGSSMAVN